MTKQTTVRLPEELAEDAKLSCVELARFGLFRGTDTSLRRLLLSGGVTAESWYGGTDDGPSPEELLDHYHLAWDDHGSVDVLYRSVEISEFVPDDQTFQGVRSAVDRLRQDVRQ